MKRKRVRVTKERDRIIVIKLFQENKLLNKVSAYDPQVGCKESFKEEFWQDTDEIVQ
jgi:hypothetical protein